MKKAGIVGGIGPASTLDYYKGIIDGCMKASGSEHYPEVVIDSIDMTEMLGYVAAGDREGLTGLLLRAIGNLAAAGAEFAAIASNTPHIVFDAVRARAQLPVISIVEATCLEAVRLGCRRTAVLGTLFTMRSGLYTEAFERYGIKASVPDQEGQAAVHGVIFPNLENGIVLPDEKERLLEMAQALIDRTGADALVLGCTELPLAIRPGDLDITLLDTAQIHIEAIVREMLKP
jgi:aspartate racemase